MKNNKKINWFKEARFGMFVHWGLYSIPARGEWVMHIEQIPKEEYAQLAKQFNPKRFNADKWVRLAISAGMKYIVLTTRHHDGFCLFDSKVSNFTSVKTAAKKDFVAEYVAACRKYKIKIGFYYSLMDWSHPEYQNSMEKNSPVSPQFIAYFQTQVKELCTNYGKIDVLWFDGEWDHSVKQWQSEKLVKMIHKLQPTALINDRLGTESRGTLGDFGTPEQYIPTAFPESSAPSRSWESCMTMNDNWGYSAGDKNWKSTRQLIMNLVRCVSGDGNFLLNVGPKPDGTIPPPSVSRLKEIGAWMKINKESIYGCGKTSFGGGMVGLTTAKNNKAYLHIFRWSGKEICLAWVKNKIKSAYLLANNKKISVSQKNDRLFIKGLPPKAPNDIDTVLVLKLDRRKNG